MKIFSDLVIIFMVFSAGIYSAHAQSRAQRGNLVNKPIDTANTPIWIKMMDDTNVVFAKAERAFYLYWKNREIPQNDNEEAEAKGGFEGESHENIKYSYEYKRFKSWEQMSKNLIGPDGRVLSPRRQIEIWEQNHKEKSK